MKNIKAFRFVFLFSIIVSACGSLQAEFSTQTAIAEIAIVASWTATPTLTPTLIPTFTNTPMPTRTPIGGGQGQILFVDGNLDTQKLEIYSVNSDGSGRKQLTFLNGTIYYPVWSPLGDKIAFAFKQEKDVGFWQLYTMNSDGSGVTKISTNDQKNYFEPDWSPDGLKIVFYSEQESSLQDQGYTRHDVFVINSDGSNEVVITNDPASPTDDLNDDKYPDWSPDGKEILFSAVRFPNYYYDIYTVNPDGTDPKRLFSFNTSVQYPKWSPDGKYVIFESDKENKGISDLYLMKADGTDVVRLTNKENDRDAFRFNFSPDGTRIIFEKCCVNFYMMNLDGSNAKKIYSEFGLFFDMKP